MKYDRSWDWLMPVVDKLEELNRAEGRIYNSTFCYHAPNRNSDTWVISFSLYVGGGILNRVDVFGTGTSKIAATYNACVKAVEKLKEHGR